MIFQGLTPGLFAALSDSFGRRPTYIICFVVYVISNIGLAETNTYWLLMLLRAIQATGNSATVALGAGVIADIATPKERGGYLGIFGVGPLTGPSLGPIIGGTLAQTLGWRAIFWFLAIFGGVFSVFLVFLLPETLRSIVGNGSLRPRSIWHKRFIDVIPCFKIGREESGSGDDESVVSHRSTLAPRKRTNMFESFKIIWQKDIALILLTPSIYYAIYIMSNTSLSEFANAVTTSVPPLFEEHYGLNTFHIGLTYIAVGVGTLVGSVGWGKRLDRDWKIVEAKYVADGGKKPQGPSDLVNFPLEHARTRTVWYPLIFMWMCTIGYGWTIQYSVCLAAPLIFQMVIGAAMVCIMSSFQALLIDLHPGRSASAAASVCPFYPVSDRR
jgi:multidrug resistance protein